MLLRVLFLVIINLFFVSTALSPEKISMNVKSLTSPVNHQTKHLQKRSQESISYDYPESIGAYDYQGYDSNPLQAAGIAGSASLALKAFKAKSILKLLKIPAGIALLGGIAALAAGLAPPAVIGSINLPFQGKRRKRSVPFEKLDPYFIRNYRKW